MMLKKLPPELENQIPREIKIFREFYFEKIESKHITQ
jgi:hypothetical protein